MGADGEVSIAQADASGTRIALAAGAVAAEVEPRAADAPFVIDAGPVDVRVVGTRFRVERSADRWWVGVDEGVVAVTAPEGSWSVEAGFALELRAGDPEAQLRPLDDPDRVRSLLLPELPVLPEPEVAPVVVMPATPEPPAFALDDLRAEVLRGRLEAAEGALRARLETHPEDADSALLLADVLRKDGRAGEAVEVCVQVGGPRRAEARYRAGVLLQDRIGDPVRAAEMFGDALDGGGLGALVPDARRRLGLALLAAGELETARAVLESVVSEHPGSSAAVDARRVLSELR